MRFVDLIYRFCVKNSCPTFTPLGGAQQQSAGKDDKEVVFAREARRRSGVRSITLIMSLDLGFRGHLIAFLFLPIAIRGCDEPDREIL